MKGKWPPQGPSEALVTTFESFSNLLSDELTEDDFVAPNLIKENLGDRENPDQILDFIMSEEGGGGMPKCYSLSYL